MIAGVLLFIVVPLLWRGCLCRAPTADAGRVHRNRSGGGVGRGRVVAAA